MRSAEVEANLYKNHRPAVEAKRHLDPGAEERGYYVIGYLQALKDLQSLIAKGSFPALTQPAEDGGPRLSARATAAE
jgi:hypothetical protein